MSKGSEQQTSSARGRRKRTSRSPAVKAYDGNVDFRHSSGRGLLAVRRALVWTVIIGAFAGVSYYISMFVHVHSFAVALAMLLGSISCPMQTMYLAFAAGFWFTPLGELAVVEILQFVSATSAALGLSLIIGAKFAPYPVMQVGNLVAMVVEGMYHSVIDLVAPHSVQVWFGILLTFVSEMLLFPAIFCLLFGVAQLKHAGEDFNANLNKPLSKGRRRHAPRVAVIFIHGNEFNECLMLRNHTKHTVTVKGCSKIALKQIKLQLAERNARPTHLILMGHSLGGAVSAYIKEYFAHEHGLPVEMVVTWSAPLAGSDLLLWGKTNAPFLNEGWLTQGIMNDFCPTALGMKDLRTRMQVTETARPGTYRAVTGSCDPLVRPGSALLPFLQKKNKVLIPYVGHYNIKVSLKAWRHVAEYLEEFLSTV